MSLSQSGCHGNRSLETACVKGFGCVDDLTRQIERLKDERPGIAARLANARMLLDDLTEQTRLFAEARILQLEARQDELRAEVAAA